MITYLEWPSSPLTNQNPSKPMTAFRSKVVKVKSSIWMAKLPRKWLVTRRHMHLRKLQSSQLTIGTLLKAAFLEHS
jgi:hypothetical protein